MPCAPSLCMHSMLAACWDHQWSGDVSLSKGVLCKHCPPSLRTTTIHVRRCHVWQTGVGGPTLLSMFALIATARWRMPKFLDSRSRITFIVQPSFEIWHGWKKWYVVVEEYCSYNSSVVWSYDDILNKNDWLAYNRFFVFTETQPTGPPLSRIYDKYSQRTGRSCSGLLRDEWDSQAPCSAGYLIHPLYDVLIVVENTYHILRVSLFRETSEKWTDWWQTLAHN